MAALSTIGCHALPLGNPADASLLCDGLLSCPNWYGLSLRTGFYGDYVFNRHLEIEIPGTPGIPGAEVYTNAGYLALNFRNRVDLFATLGASEVDLIVDQPIFGNMVGAEEQIFSQTDFSWSLGLRGTLFRYCGLILGLEGQYFRVRPHLDTVRVAGVFLTFPFIKQIDVRYQEWQVGIGLSYPIAIAACGATALVPYIGYKYSWPRYDFFNQLFVDGSISVQVESTRLENARHHGGYAVGVTLVGCKKASITAEARFVDEKALHINSQFRF